MVLESHFSIFYLPWSIGLKCDVNNCVTQVKSLDPVLEEKKAQKRFFIHSTYCTVLIEHYLYERITANFRVE